MKRIRLVATLLVAVTLLCFASPATADQTEILATTPVAIVGRYAPGGTIRAIFPTDDGVSATFSWRSNGETIQEGSASNLLLSEAEVGATISATITLHKAGLPDRVFETAGEVVASSMPDATGSMGWGNENIPTPGCFSPREDQFGGAKVGWQIWFSCNPYNTNFGAPATQTFAWCRNGQLLAGENRSQYRLTTADSGQHIWATYRAAWANGYVFTEMKKMVAAIPYELQVAKPTIRGIFKFKGKLTANTAGWDPEATLSYQWFRDYAPIDGATLRTYRLGRIDLDKNIQVMVTAQRPGYTSASRVSEPVIDGDVATLDASVSYKKIYSSYQPTNTAYDISYITSPTMTQDALAHEQALVQKAADFWSPEYTPDGVTIVYLTKDDTAWAEALIQEHPSWSNGIPGGIRSWIEGRNCGFALAFMAEQKQVFVQCVHLGADHSLNDDQVSIHEYSHWFQYQQNSALYSSKVPWLVEGQANFYGLALGIGPADPELEFINTSLAGHSTQWDLYNGYTWGTFKMLDILEAGDVYETQILLARNGLVWDSYYLGGLASEWLIAHYGHAKYVQWTQNFLRNKGQTRDTEAAANATAFSEAFGFEYSELPFRLTPYIAARSAQVRKAWNDKRDPEVHSQTIGSTQQILPFAQGVTTLNKPQKAWVTNRITDGPVAKITCRARYNAQTTENEKVIMKMRAQNTCDFAKITAKTPLATVVELSMTQVVTDVGPITVTFE